MSSYVVSDCRPGDLAEIGTPSFLALAPTAFCFARTSDGFVWFASRSRWTYRLRVLGYNIGANRPRYGSSIHGSGSYRLLKTAES